MKIKNILFTSFLFFLLLADYASASEVPGLVLSYDWSKDEGNIVVDNTGHGFNATNMNTIRIQNSYDAYYRRFLDNTGANINLTSLSLSAPNSIEFIFNKSTIPDYTTLFDFASGGSNYKIKIINNRLLFQTASSYYRYSDPILPNTTYHVIFTNDDNTGNNIHCYINGELADNNSYSVSDTPDTVTNLKIESASLMDLYLVNVYNKSLSGDEVSQAYEAQQWRYNPNRVSFSSSYYNASKIYNSYNVTAKLSVASGTSVIVNYTTVDGTATAGNEYNFTSGMLVFAPGETEKNITIPLNCNDGNVWWNLTNRYFYLNLTSSNMDLISPSNTTIFIKNNGGIVLSFDDGSNIDNWYQNVRPILLAKGVHATFFISNPASDSVFNETLYAKMRTLYNEGNEIADHGYNHQNESGYLAIPGNTVNSYLAYEIFPAIKWFNDNNYSAVTHALPQGQPFENLTTSECLKRYFAGVRSTSYLSDSGVNHTDDAYYNFSGDRYTRGLLIEDYYVTDIENIYNGMDRAKANGEVLIVYGHRIDGSMFTTTRVQNILDYAVANGLTVYRYRDIFPPLQNVTVNFSTNVSSINPLTIQFNDTSVGQDGSGYPAYWLWNFGDGNTSTEQNPIHAFSDKGTYNVTLIATNAGGFSGVKSMAITIPVQNATPTITWNNPVDITYGTALNSTHLNAVATDPSTGNNVAGTFVYTPPAGTVLNAGTQTLSVNFTPTDTVNYTAASKSVTINVSKATPEITWSNPANITYGTVLSSIQLNATASVLGSFIYTPPEGTLLDVGAHSLYVDFTPIDTVNYTAASKSVTINVREVTPTDEIPGYTMKIDFTNVVGSTILDGAGGPDGTLVNVARTQLPSGAYYGTFGGDWNSYVDLTNRADLDFGSNFTIEAWIRPDIPNSYGAIMAKGWVHDGYQYMLADTGTKCTPYANFTNSGWVYCDSQENLNNNSWYQVVWAVETNNTEGFPQHSSAYVYVNMDRSLPSSTDGQIIGSSSYNAYLGRGGYGNYKGDILLVRVYRRMLSPAEIYQNYVATAPLVMPEVKIENSSYIFENGAGSQNINITLDNEAVNTVSYVDVRAFGGTASSSDYNTDNNSNSGLIAAIGDGITGGSNVYYNNAHGYVGYISQNLSAADNWTIINFGVGGYTTDSVLSEYNSYIQPYHPSYGILLIGTNDIFRYVKSATYVENNIETIVGRMVEDNITPILTTIPPASTNTIETNNTMTAVNAWIRDYAAINGYHCVDLYTLLADPNNPDLMKVDMTTDGIHLSQLGYQVWSNAINPEWFKNDRRRVYFLPGETLATFNTEILNNPESGNKTFKVDLFTPSGVYFSGVQESSVTINESKAIPSITWSNPADITYGTALNNSQLNAVATDPVTGNNVPGNFVYTPSEGTLPGVGTHTLHVDFTPTDSANYTIASKDVTINVNKTAPIITWSNPANLTYGIALNSSQLNAVASVSGSFVYNPASGTVLDVGTHTLHVDFTPADTINYTTATADVTINVSERTKETPVITWSDPAAITYGTALNEAQLNALASVPGSFVYSPAYGTILGAGTQTLQATFTPTDSVNYTIATSNVSLTVNKATPLITWNNPDAISYGTALSSTQLNAVASVPGSFVYNPTFGRMLSAGTHNLQANFTPIDSVNYTTVSKTVTINISKAIPSITWSNPANIAYGTALSGTQLNAVASVPGSFVYSPASGTVLGAGTQTLQTTFTPTDTINYTTASKTVAISISKGTPVITWSGPAAITYGTALNEAQLNALASVLGSFVYSPAYGTILGAGTQTLQTTFTPTNSVNYTTATSNVSLTVNKATPLITWNNPDAISYGTALSGTQLNAVASVPGSFVYNPASGTVLSAGTHDLQANFTPTDGANYTNIAAIVKINVLSQPILPVADFNANVFSGYAPLSVTFIDLSQNATSWSWDFGDGATSIKQNPKHVYPAAGTYTVKLTAINANGTDSKIATLTVYKKIGGKSRNNNNGGSPEPARNVEVKELSQAFITNDKAVKFDFSKKATCVVYVGFDAKKTAGKTVTIVEHLKNKSTLVSNLSEGEVYRYFNVWVGNSGFATSTNIENPAICFKVENSWIKDKKIDKDSIALNRYSNKKWEQLPASLSGEDSKYLYFTADVPGYSFFAITGETIATPEKTDTEIQSDDSENSEDMENINSEANQESGEEEKTGMPGFEIVYGIAGTLVVFLYKKIKIY